jgi:hypothetical protein
LIRRLLVAEGFHVKWSTKPTLARWHRWLETHAVLGWTQPWYDTNLFLERFSPLWFGYAKQNILIPNPEWFVDEQFEHFAGIDEVFCKTEEAAGIFQALGKKVTWTGFTGRDCWEGTLAATRPMRALHLAGRSELKGTRYVLEVWRRHPEWPELTVVKRPHGDISELDTSPANNLRFMVERLSEKDIQVIRQEHPLWILPSEVEGYGQTLSEGLSVGAIVMTTDAAPMNEIIRPDRGVLVRARHADRMHLGNRYIVESEALEVAVSNVLDWTPERRLAVGAAARKWFVENDQRFRRDISDSLGSVSQRAARQVR